MICRTIGRTIMFSQVGFPPSTAISALIPSSCSSALGATGGDLRHQPRYGPWDFIRASGSDPGHDLASAPSAAICAGTLKKTKQNGLLRWPQIQARNVSN
jgi:hypothetical protein